MTKDKPKKLTNEDRRRLYYRKLYGLDKPESSGDLKTDIKRYINEADKEKKLSKPVPLKPIDVDGITKSRMKYEKIMGDFDYD